MRLIIEGATAKRLAAIAEDVAKTFREGGEEALKRDFGGGGAFYGSGATARIEDVPMFEFPALPWTVR